MTLHDYVDNLTSGRFLCYALNRGRRGGLMVSALDSGASAPGSSGGLGHCVVFLGKTFHSHGASLSPLKYNLNYYQP